MNRLIAKTNDRVSRNGFTRPFIGQSVSRVHSLRSIGAPTLISFSRRPKLHPWTIKIIEMQVAKAKLQPTGWAEEIVPNYDVLLTSERRSSER